MAFFDGTRRRERFGQVFLPAVLSRAYLAWCHAELGTFAEGRPSGKKGFGLPRRLLTPAALCVPIGGLVCCPSAKETCPGRSPCSNGPWASVRMRTSQPMFPRMAAALGAAYTLAGRVADAVPLLTQAMEQAIAVERVDVQMLCRLPLGEAQLLAGRLEEAQTLAEQALMLAREHQERGNQAYALRLLGDIAARREPPEGEPAEAYYRQALALAEELGMRPLQAHCHRGLGTAVRRDRPAGAARTALSAALDAVPGHGHDLLASPDGGSPGPGRRVMTVGKGRISARIRSTHVMQGLSSLSQRERAGGEGLGGLAHPSEAPHPNPLPAGEGTEGVLYRTPEGILDRQSP